MHRSLQLSVFLFALGCMTASCARSVPKPVRHRGLLAFPHKRQPNQACKDLYEDCASWAQEGLCDPGWTVGAMVCPASCNHCLYDHFYMLHGDSFGAIDANGNAVNPNDWLGIHNYYRALHGVPALEADDSLTFSAQEYANDLASDCSFQHSAAPIVGENLAAGFFDWSSTIKAWYDENSRYDFKKPDFSEATGHFTQVVWKSSTHVGCGVVSNANCEHNFYYVCLYDPAGNVLTKFADNVTPPLEFEK